MDETAPWMLCFDIWVLTYFLFKSSHRNCNKLK